MRLLKYLTKKEWGLIALTLCLILLQVFLDLTLPDYMSQIAELVETPDSELPEILNTGIKMLLTAMGALVISVITVFLGSRVAASFSANLRMRLFTKVQGFSLHEMERFGVPSLITRTTNDVLQVRMVFVLGLEVFIKAPILSIWAIVKIALLGAEWSALTVIGILIMLLISVLCFLACMPKFRKMQRLADDIGRITRENLSGLRTVRALNGEALEEARFEHSNEELTQTHLFTAHTLSVLAPGLQFFNNLLTIGIYFVAMLFFNAVAPEARIGVFSDTVAVLSYALRILSAFLLVASLCTLLPRAIVCAKRISEVLAVHSLVCDGSLQDTEAKESGTLEFRNVSFFYEGSQERALRHVSFKVGRGETLGIIGVSGSGKSTLAALIPRLYDASEGEILLNGENVKRYAVKELRKRIGFVPQRPFLFEGTLAENVALGTEGEKECSLEELHTLLRTVGAEELSDAHKQGGDFSDGEAQRIALARALYKKPELLVLDDAFSFYDSPTAEKLRGALRKTYPSMTKVIVSQRVVAVCHADRIVVMEDGAVLDIGTHEELLLRCELYAHMARAQGERGRVQ